MKKIVNFLIIVLATTNLVAQSQLKKISNNNAESNQGYITSAYQLFPTQNMYTFIKLDTRNGQIWQVQWSPESKSRFETILSSFSLVGKDACELH